MGKKTAVTYLSVSTRTGRERLIWLAAQYRNNDALASAIGIREQTLYRWMREHPELREDIDEGRSIAVKEALLERAIGGTHEIHKGMKLRKREYDAVTGKCIRESEVIEPYTEEIYTPPDTNAARFWLMNRKKEEWTEQETEVVGKSLEMLLKEIADGK